MKFTATIKNGALKFNPKEREDFVEYLSANEGEELDITSKESYASRKFLEGAVVDVYCEHKYNIPLRNKNRKHKRSLFMQDFNYEIISSKTGDPIKVERETSKGQVARILKEFTDWAIKDLCPVPNSKLHKIWKDQWSMDYRFACYYDWLDFLGIETDAMPTNETFKKLYEENKVEYPKEEFNPKFD